MSNTDSRGTQSIDHTVEVLKQVVAQGSHGLTVAELVAISKLERPTVHRIVQALERQGLLKRPAGSKRYVLGHYCARCQPPSLTGPTEAIRSPWGERTGRAFKVARR